MSEGDRRPGRICLRWALSLAFGAGLNALMLALLVVVPRVRLAPPSPALEVRLLAPMPQLRTPKARAQAPRTPKLAAPHIAPPALAQPPQPSPPSLAAGAAQPVGAGSSPVEGAGAADLGKAFRARVGCADPSGFRLTPQERDGCARRLGQGAQTAAFIPAPIDPGKRAWFDATAAAYKTEGHLPAPVCKVFFSGPKTRFKPAHGLKVPGLPCYLIPPKGVLTDEADVAPPEHVETR